MPASAPRSITCVSRGRSTGASFDAMSTSARSPSILPGESFASPTRVPSAIDVSDSRSGPRRLGVPDRRSRIASSSALSSTAPADWLSASARSANGERGLVVCGSHFIHSSSFAQAGSTIAAVTNSFGACSPKSCTPRPRSTSAARCRGPAMPIAPELGSSSTNGTSSIVLVARAELVDLPGVAGDAALVGRLLDRVATPCPADAEPQREEVPVLGPAGPQQRAEPHRLLVHRRHGGRLGVPALALDDRLAREAVLEILDLGLERLDLEAQLLALLRALADEVAEHHQRREGDDEQRVRAPREGERREPEHHRRGDHRPREQPRLGLGRHGRMPVLRARVPHLDARRPVEHEGAAAFEHGVGRGIRAGHDRERHLGVADRDDLAGDHADPLHEPAVDEQPVRGVEVDELHALVDLDPRVPLRHERVGEDHVDAGVASDHAVAAAQRNSRPASGPLRTCMIAAAAPSPHDRGAGRMRDDRRIEARADRRVADEQVGRSTTGSLEVGGATARVSAACGARASCDDSGSLSAIARAMSSTVAVESAVTTTSTVRRPGVGVRA